MELHPAISQAKALFPAIPRAKEQAKEPPPASPPAKKARGLLQATSRDREENPAKELPPAIQKVSSATEALPETSTAQDALAILQGAREEAATESQSANRDRAQSAQLEKELQSAKAPRLANSPEVRLVQALVLVQEEEELDRALEEEAE